MQHEPASQVISLMLELGEKLDGSVQKVQSSSSEEDFIRYRAAVGKLMGIMLLDIMNPIFQEHPDLKPHQLR
jgi:hypothetical protein